jgi:hypothetical protein
MGKSNPTLRDEESALHLSLATATSSFWLINLVRLICYGMYSGGASTGSLSTLVFEEVVLLLFAPTTEVKDGAVEIRYTLSYWFGWHSLRLNI